MAERKMYRYAIPVDDVPVTFALTGDPVAVAPNGEALVEFWAEYDQDAGHTDRSFQVFGTGQPLPEGAQWIGTCSRTALGLVWHLYEVTPDA